MLQRVTSSASARAVAANGKIRCLSASTKGVEWIRLSKLMSQLDLCSRREADALIRNKQVVVQNVVAELGQKVPSNWTARDIEITTRHGTQWATDDETVPAIVLNKPIDYVSGQPQDGHTPAVRLLTRENLGEASRANDFEFRGGDFKTLQGYVPAGRLDLESRGALIFCKSGVVAKKLVSGKKIEKEYIITVEPAFQVSKTEREMGITKIPRPSNDLKFIQRGGLYLAQESRSLKPAKASWLERGHVLKLILKEGRKHQIRRMCRELLGYHVVDLKRVRIGPVNLDGLEEGMWRPLTKPEVDEIVGRD